MSQSIQIPSFESFKESASIFSHFISNKAIVYGGKLFTLIGLKDIHRGLYKEAYLNNDYKTAVSITSKGLLKFAFSSALIFSTCLGTKKVKGHFFPEQPYSEDNEQTIEKTNYIPVPASTSTTIINRLIEEIPAIIISIAVPGIPQIIYYKLKNL